MKITIDDHYLHGERITGSRDDTNSRTADAMDKFLEDMSGISRTEKADISYYYRRIHLYLSDSNIKFTIDFTVSGKIKYIHGDIKIAFRLANDDVFTSFEVSTAKKYESFSRVISNDNDKTVANLRAFIESLDNILY